MPAGLRILPINIQTPMNLRYKMLILGCMAAITAVGCRTEVQSGSGNERVLAMVNGSSITADDIYLRLQDRFQESTPREREVVLEDMIQEELLYQQGLKLGLDRDAKYRNKVRILEMRLREFRRAEIARRVASTRIMATVAVTEEEAREYYERNKTMMSTELHLLYAQFDDHARAAAAMEQLQNGAAFESVALAGSVAAGSESQHVHDTGFRRWDQIPREWTETVYRMNKGAAALVSSSTRAGTVIIKLLDARRNDGASYELMSGSIVNRLRELRGIEAYDRYIEDLKKQSRIVITDERRKAS